MWMVLIKSFILQFPPKPVLGSCSIRAGACVIGAVDNFIHTKDILIRNCGARIEVTFFITTIGVDWECFCVCLCCPDTTIITFVSSDLNIVHTVTDWSWRRNGIVLKSPQLSRHHRSHYHQHRYYRYPQSSTIITSTSLQPTIYHHNYHHQPLTRFVWTIPALTESSHFFIGKCCVVNS